MKTFSGSVNCACNKTVKSVFMTVFVVFLSFSCQKEEIDPYYLAGDAGINVSRIGDILKGKVIKDIDNNVYKTIMIGTQLWMAENLRTTRLNDGTPVPMVTGNPAWWNSSSPAYCWYADNIKNSKIYGALYNWYAVETGKLCPVGWHVPTHNEMSELVSYLGGTEVAGGKLKEAGTKHWIYPNTGADNSSGFTALPGGSRGTTNFHSLGEYGSWWADDQYD